MAKVLTSVSGLPISAASAGYSPTNSGDVSAIASGYQVVSATATQLYAGTAYLTSVNDAPVSASRAGNAANASLATSAYYDGTGRLISALPDAAEVSSIASSYAESAASGKLDSTAQVVSATAGDGTYVTAINGMGLSGQGGGGAQVVTATGSASAFEGWWPPFTTSYLVSSINGSALLPYGYSALSANSANWNSVYNTVSSNSASWSGSTGGSVTSPSGTIVVSGSNIEGTNSAVMLQQTATGFIQSLQKINSVNDIGPYLQQITYNQVNDTGANLRMEFNETVHVPVTILISGRDSLYTTQSASSLVSIGESTASIPLGSIVQEISASASDWLHFPNYFQYFIAEKPPESGIVGVGELAWNSALTGVSATVANNSASWGQGGVDSATVSAIASSYAESAASSKADSSDVSGVIDTVSSNSASWGQGGVDSATVSAIASGYAESAVSSKADSSSLSSYALSADVSGCIDTVSANSASWGGGATGDYVEKSATEVAIGSANTARNTAFAQGTANRASSYSFAQGYNNSASSISFAQGIGNTASGLSFAQGGGNSAINTAAVFGEYNLSGDGDTTSGNSAAFAIGDGTAWNARHDLMLVTKDGEITMYSSTADTVGTGIMSSIRAISAAATGGGVDSATVSAIASSYAESAASSKMDTSGMTSYALSSDVSGTVDLVSTQSANWGGSALALSAGPGVTLTKSGNTLIAGLDETVLWSGNPEKTTTTAKTYSLSEDLRNFTRYRVVVNPHEQSAGAMQRPCQEFTFNLEYNTTSSPIYAQFPAYTIGGNILTINYWYLTGAVGTCTSLGVLAGVRQTDATVTTGITAYSGSIVKIVGLNRTAGV